MAIAFKVVTVAQGVVFSALWALVDSAEQLGKNVRQIVTAAADLHAFWTRVEMEHVTHVFCKEDTALEMFVVLGSFVWIMGAFHASLKGLNALQMTNAVKA
ncbi:MAG: hypothetical protein QXN37_01280 [Candidatus Anstonellaceae archaeon]